LSTTDYFDEFDGYLRKLITNDRVAHYLEQYQPELFIEFQKIAEMTVNRRGVPTPIGELSR
jgi:hypothetical protein